MVLLQNDSIEGYLFVISYRETMTFSSICIKAADTVRMVKSLFKFRTLN